MTQGYLKTDDQNYHASSFKDQSDYQSKDKLVCISCHQAELIFSNKGIKHFETDDKQEHKVDCDYYHQGNIYTDPHVKSINEHDNQFFINQVQRLSDSKKNKQRLIHSEEDVAYLSLDLLDKRINGKFLNIYGTIKIDPEQIKEYKSAKKTKTYYYPFIYNNQTNYLSISARVLSNLNTDKKNFFNGEEKFVCLFGQVTYHHKYNNFTITIKHSNYLAL